MAWPPIPQTLVSSSFPVNFGYTYLQVSNTQSVATPTNFQQYIQLPPQLSLNTWPLRFYADPALTQPLYAWYETPTTVWVLLPNGIPANSSINIYFNVDEPDGVYTGMAPYLSSTYGALDNGANVFNNYWNFAGTSAPSGINVYSSTGSVTFNNGVTIKGGTTKNGGENGIATSASFSAPIIVDYYGTQSTSPSGETWGWNMVGFSNYLSSSNATPGAGGTHTIIDFEASPGGKPTPTPNAQPLTNQGGTVTGGTLSTPSSNLFPNSVWTHIYTSSTYYTYQNYVNSTGYITGASNTASLPFEIEVGNNEGSYVPNGMTVYWLRTHAYPPNGVQPSVSFV